MNFTVESSFPPVVLVATLAVMAAVSLISQGSASAPNAGARRERVCIDLRALRPALSAAAHSLQISVPALVRLVLADWLESRAEPGIRDAALTGPPEVPGSVSGDITKVTLRLPGSQAVRLARAARASECSQGAYVSGLIEGIPPQPVPRDQRENRSALVQSTATLAALSGDLQAFIRLLRVGGPPETKACTATVAMLADAISKHLVATAPLVAAQSPSRRRAEAGPVQLP